MDLNTPITSEQDAAQRVIAVIGAAPKQIKTQEDYEVGMQWIGQLVVRRKKVEEFFESLKKPIRQALNAVRSKEEKVLEPLMSEEVRVKQGTGRWFMDQQQKAKERQDLENQKHETKVQEAIDKGKDPESVAPPKIIASPQTSVKSDGGPTITMRLVKNWRVTKLPAYCQKYEQKIYRSEHAVLQELPDTVWVLDTARAMSAAKSGLTPALELYDVPSQAVSG